MIGIANKFDGCVFTVEDGKYYATKKWLVSNANIDEYKSYLAAKKAAILANDDYKDEAKVRLVASVDAAIDGVLK